jgi:hypothetical protein
MSTAEERMLTWKFESRQPENEATGSAGVRLEQLPTRPVTARTESTSYARAVIAGSVAVCRRASTARANTARQCREKGPRTGKDSLLLAPFCSQARPQIASSQRRGTSILRHSLTKNLLPAHVRALLFETTHPLSPRDPSKAPLVFTASTHIRGNQLTLACILRHIRSAESLAAIFTNQRLSSTDSGTMRKLLRMTDLSQKALKLHIYPNLRQYEKSLTALWRTHIAQTRERTVTTAPLLL